MTQANEPPEVNPYVSPAGESSSAETVRFETPAGTVYSLFSVFGFFVVVALGFLLVPLFLLATFQQTSGVPSPLPGQAYPDWLMQIAVANQRTNRWELIKYFAWSLIFASGFTFLTALAGVPGFLIHFLFGLGWWLAIPAPIGLGWILVRFPAGKRFLQSQAIQRFFRRNHVAEHIVPWNPDTKRFQLVIPAATVKNWGADVKLSFRTVNPSGVVVECQDSASGEVLQQSYFPRTEREGWTEVPAAIAFSLTSIAADKIAKRTFVVYSQDDYPWVIPGV